MPYRTQHRGFEARPPYNTVEPEQTRYSSGVTEEQKQGISEGFQKTGKFLGDVYQDAKEFKDWRNPLNYGSNIGAAAIRAGEGFVTFDATNPQEFAMESVGKLMDIQKPWAMVAKELPTVANNLNRLGRKTDEVLSNAGELLGINPKTLQESAVSINDGMMINPRQDMDLAELSAQPLASLSGVNPGSLPAGSTKLRSLKAAMQIGSKNDIKNVLSQGASEYLDPKYKDARKGYFNANKLSKDPELLNKVIEKHDEINILFNKYKELQARGASKKQISDAQRILYDKIGESYFDDSALIYGQHPLGKAARKKLVEVSQWFSKDHWHHIFGNKEIGEYMLTEIAQDPLVAINLFKHMKKLGLTSSGVADNILIMKQAGHQNFHDFYKAIGIQPQYANRAPGDISDFGQEIAKVARGDAKATKTFTTATGEVIEKGTPYAKDPTAINHLFSMLDVYNKHNKFLRQKFKEGAITVMEPIGTKGLRKVVPNGYKPKKGEQIFVYDLTANKGGQPRMPEVYSHKAGNIRKILDANQ